MVENYEVSECVDENLAKLLFEVEETTQ